MATLHITNGDVAAEGLRRSQLDGDVLPWRDVLHDGPVRALPTDEFREQRARFLGCRFGAVTRIRRDIADRDERLLATASGDTIVLWFEPDLYDQLQLVEVLHRISALPSHPKIFIAPADELLGPLDAAQFGPMYKERRRIRDSDVDLAIQAWNAITSATPEALASFVADNDGERSYGTHTDDRLPYLKQALSRWLEELPSTSGGLSRTERQACAALEDGELSFADLFARATRAAERWIWLGDSSFAWYLERLSNIRQPLISLDSGEPFVAPAESEWRGVGAKKLRLAAFGREVLGGKADAIASNGIDRWFGGTHLTSENHWRRDDSSAAVVHVRRADLGT